jgi:hypothetical protein
MPAYNDRRLLLFQRDQALPRRCLACGRPAKKYLSDQVSWVPPATYLLFFVAGPVLVLLIMLAVRKSARVQLPFCKRHREHRASRRAAANIAFAVAVALLIFAVAIGSWTPVLPSLAFFAAMLWLARPTQRPAQMKDGWIWMQGVAPDLIGELDKPPIALLERFGR